MMYLLRNIRSSRRNPFRGAIAIFTLFLVLFPIRSFAQCEPPPAASAAAATITAQDEASILMMANVNLEQLFWTFDLDQMRTALGMQDQQDWQKMFTGTLNPFWTEWLAALKGMTAQLSAATTDETFKLGMINDASNALAAARDEQKERIKAKLEFQPTDQACRFDTDADFLAKDRAIDEAVQNGFEWDFVTLGNNEDKSIAQYGPGELQNQRWDIYQHNFCDYKAEDCDSGCSQTPWLTPSQPDTCKQDPNLSPQPQDPNADIYVSNMLFKNETIPVDNPVAWKAMQSMMFNVTGYKVPDLILARAVGTDPGIEQMFIRREYMARMSAVDSLLYSVVGDRMEGAPAPEPQQIRTMMGIASPTKNPSMRELRQSIIEQLWDPNFYKNLGNNPATISQKELFLKAYGLTMLYDMIAKQEKISTAYAIETAAMLKRTENVSGNLSNESPNSGEAP